MAVFGTLMGLVFWVFVYLCCCAKDKNDEREQVKLLRYRHEAEEYKEIYDYIDEVSDYYYNVLGGGTGKEDQMVARFPELGRYTIAPQMGWLIGQLTLSCGRYVIGIKPNINPNGSITQSRLI